jgi:hypothetical protein
MKLSSVASLVNRQGESGRLASGLGTLGHFVLVGPEVVDEYAKKLGTFGSFRFLVRAAAGESVRGIWAGGGIGFEVVMGVFFGSWHIVARGLH